MSRCRGFRSGGVGSDQESIVFACRLLQFGPCMHAFCSPLDFELAFRSGRVEEQKRSWECSWRSIGLSGRDRRVIDDDLCTVGRDDRSGVLVVIGELVRGIPARMRARGVMVHSVGMFAYLLLLDPGVPSMSCARIWGVQNYGAFRICRGSRVRVWDMILVRHFLDGQQPEDVGIPERAASNQAKCVEPCPTVRTISL